MKRAVLWLGLAVLVATAAASLVWIDRIRDAEVAALVELGRLRHQLEVSQADAAEAKRVAQAMGDSAQAIRLRGDSIRRETAARAAAARRDAEEAEGLVRAALDSLGASTAAVDRMVDAHHEEVVALQEEILTLTAERDGYQTYAERMVVALDASERRAEAAEALAANVDALWSAERKRREAAEKRNGLYKAVAIAGAAVAAWEHVGG